MMNRQIRFWLITEELERLDVRNLMRKHIENEGIFGMSHLFVKTQRTG